MNIFENNLLKLKNASIRDKCYTLYETLSNITLSFLGKTLFFDNVALYGDYLNLLTRKDKRYSNVINFAVLNENNHLDVLSYLEMLKTEFNNLNMDIEVFIKKLSTFLNVTNDHIERASIEFLLNDDIVKKYDIPKNIKIYIELNKNPQKYAVIEHRYLPFDTQADITAFDIPSNLSYKIAEIIIGNFRKQQDDKVFYDYLYYINNNACFNLKYLDEKLKIFGIVDENIKLCVDDVKKILINQIEKINFDRIDDTVLKEKNLSSNKILNKNLFIKITNKLKSSF